MCKNKGCHSGCGCHETPKVCCIKKTVDLTKGEQKVITHNLQSTYVHVTMRDASTGEIVLGDRQHMIGNGNQISITSECDISVIIEICKACVESH